MRKVQAQPEGAGKRVAILVSRWNEMVTKQLLEGAVDELESFGVIDVTVISVPGTWEMPPVARRLFASESPPDAIVALGCILQGQTPHAKYLASDVGAALMSLQTEYGKPIAWGVLTPDDEAQALDRAGLKHGNKGREAARAALEVASLLERL